MSWLSVTARCSRTAHKELFHFSDEVYILAGEQDNVFDTILAMVNTVNAVA